MLNQISITKLTKEGLEMVEITTSNCNFWLTRLYKQRDQIGSGIDRAVVTGHSDTVRKLEREYEEICDRIDQFIEFRRHHDCLLEGDPGYGYR